MAPGDDGGDARPICGPREQRLRDRFGERLGAGVVGIILAVVIVAGVVVSVAGSDPGSATAARPATILGTLPVDPRVPPGGIPVAFAAPAASSTTTSPTAPPGTGGSSTPPGSTQRPPVLDDFSRSGAVGSTPSGLAWRVEAGTWTVADGALQGRAPASGGAVTVAAGGGSLAFGATATQLPNGAGLVFHWKDAHDYLGLVAEPGVGGWSFEAVIRSRLRYRKGIVLTTAKPGVPILVRISGRQVTVTAGSERPTPFTLPSEADPGGDRVGFVLSGGATSVGWSEAVFGS